jgi:hypothetical protein
MQGRRWGWKSFVSIDLDARVTGRVRTRHRDGLLAMVTVDDPAKTPFTFPVETPMGTGKLKACL